MYEIYMTCRRRGDRMDLHRSRLSLQAPHTDPLGEGWDRIEEVIAQNSASTPGESCLSRSSNTNS